MPVLNPTILLTGATGYIGRHLLWQLLNQGYRVGVLVRRKKGCPRERLVDLLKLSGPFPLEYLDVMEGDLARPDCGIDPETLEKLATTAISAVIHCAGMTRFDTHLAEEIYLHNLQGTRHVYALARDLGIQDFHYMSTAYVAGDSRRVFRHTDLDVGQGFHNPYEASKFEVEKYLHDAGLTDAVRVAVYRPGIVVGGYPLGENNVVSTVYTFLKASHFIRECCRRDLERGRGIFGRCGVRQDSDAMLIPLRIAADPGLRVNLILIDSVVDRIMQGLVTAMEKYTVVPLLGNDFSLVELHDAFCHALGIKGVRFVDNSDFEQAKRTIIEENFFRATLSYQPYLFAAPVFADEEKSMGTGINIEKIAVDFCELLEARAAEKQRGALNRLALHTLGITGPQDYFHRFVNGQLGEGFLKRIPYVDTKIRFLIRGEPDFDQVIHFDRGSIRYVKEMKFDCSYELNQPLFNDIVNGRTDLKNAFFDGMVRIGGDRETALKFGFLFSDYFQDIDERIIEELAGQ